MRSRRHIYFRPAQCVEKARALNANLVLLPSPVMRLEPKNLQLIGTELAIQWDDGSESYLPLDFLRRACPCAACGGEPDVLGRIERPNVNYTAESFALHGWNLVGGYAVQPRWGDGHGTGIYSYQYLRRLAQPG